MANEYYSASGTPATRSQGSSAPIRTEYTAIQAAFDKLPLLAGNNNAAVVVNSAGTGLTVSTSSLPVIAAGKTVTFNNTITFAGVDGKTATFNNSITFAGTDATTMTFPSTSATVARTDAANTFTGVQTFSTPIAAASVAAMTATVGGRVPTPPNNTTTFLRGDGTFAAPGGASPFVGFISGRLYGPYGCISSGTFGPGTNSIVLMPFFCPVSQLFTKIGINVTVASGNIRLGIYSSGPTNAPNALLLDAGNVAVGSTGLNTATISQTLPPGLYWLAYFCDNNTLVATSVTANAQSMMGLYGETTALASTSVSYNQPSTFGALPPTVGGTLSAAAQSNYIFLEL